MINQFKIEEIANHFNVSIEWFIEKREYYGAYNALERTIYLWHNIEDNEIAQILFHELCHVIDPKSIQKMVGEISEVEELQSELLAELVAKEFAGNNFFDDGYIEDLESVLSEKRVKDVIENVPEYVKVLEEVL